MGTPADVVKSRMMNQPYNEHGVGLYYKSSIDCLVTTVSEGCRLELIKTWLQGTMLYQLTSIQNYWPNKINICVQ